MQKALIAALLLFPVVCIAQIPDTALINKIKNEALNHSAIPRAAYYLTDVCGPRLTNSPGYRKAVKWSVDQLKTWGIKAAPEAWGEYGKGWSNEAASLIMKVPYIKRITAYAIPWTESTPGPITAEVIFMDKLDSASVNNLGDKIKGKIVLVKKANTLIEPSFESDAWRYADTDLVKLRDREMLPDKVLADMKLRLNNQYNVKLYLKQKGAVALMNCRGRDGTVFVSNNLGYAKEYAATLPEMVTGTEDYLMMQRFFEHGQKVELEINISNTQYTDDLTGYNVVAEIPGTDPKLKSEIVMIGAHLDSWTSATGATDNGAGCVVMMEVMRIMKTLNLQPKRTIRLALWGGEEQVILGSVGYVKNHFANPADMKLKPEHSLISAYYNLDNGTGKIRGIYLMGNEKAGGKLTEWLKPFADMGVTTVSSKYSGGSDQLSFDAVGIPAFPFIQDPMDYDTRTHHSNVDVYNRLSIPDLKQCAAIITTIIYQTAMEQSRMPRKTLPQAGKFALLNGLKL
jgi:carboxypeptidase Q